MEGMCRGDGAFKNRMTIILIKRYMCKKAGEVENVGCFERNVYLPCMEESGFLKTMWFISTLVGQLFTYVSHVSSSPPPPPVEFVK